MHLPADDSANGWENVLRPRTPRAALSGHIRADWLVIGAGLAGLAAARRLASNLPGEQVALLEATHVGGGSSGRNSGFVIDLAHNVGAIDRGSLQAARRAMRVSRAAIEHLDEVRRAHGFDCGWSPGGQYMPAVSPAGEAVLDATQTQLDALDEPYRRLGRDELFAEVGTHYYRSAVHTPGTVLVQPVELVRGLADSLPANVTLYENTPVQAIDYGSTIKADCAGGSVTADKVIVAVNGFAPDFGLYRGRLFSLRLFASLSEPLTSAQREVFDMPPWGVVPSLAFGGATLRYTNDHRLLARYDIRYAPRLSAPHTEHAGIRDMHCQLLRARFPQLGDIELRHTWSGQIVLSSNFAPGLGKHAPNVFSAVCQNGMGLTKGTMNGLLAADLACGEDNPLLGDMLAPGAPARLPPQPLLDWGARFNLWRWTRAARCER